MSLMSLLAEVIIMTIIIKIIIVLDPILIHIHIVLSFHKKSSNHHETLDFMWISRVSGAVWL